MDQPEVRVSVPGRPAAAADVLQDGWADRLRPRPRLRTFLASAAALVLVAGPVAVQHERDDRAREDRLDSAAREAVTVEVDPSDGAGSGLQDLVAGPWR